MRLHAEFANERRSVQLLILAALFAPSLAIALSGSPTVGIVFLNTDCTRAGHTLGGDCFESVAALETVIWSVIKPTAENPLIVDIGPGTFEGTLSCGTGQGYVTLRGAGRERSIITTNGVASIATFSAIGCKNLTMQDLTLQNTGDGASSSALLIRNTREQAGPVTLTHVNLIARHGYAWYETGPVDGRPKVEHFVFGSRLVGGVAALVSTSGRSWFYGSHLVLETSSPPWLSTGSPATPHVVVASQQGDVRLFGSSLTVVADDLHSSVTEIVGVRLPEPGATGGEFQMQGGVITVDTQHHPGVAAIGIHNGPEAGPSRTVATAFQLVTAPGTGAERVRGGGDHRTLLGD